MTATIKQLRRIADAARALRDADSFGIWCEDETHAHPNCQTRRELIAALAGCEDYRLTVHGDTPVTGWWR